MHGKVLVVDDDPILLRASARILRSAGYDVAEASSGDAALGLARQLQPDLMLLDVHMPDMDGLEVCRRLKADPFTNRILIVMLSSTMTGSDFQAHGMELGADDYLARPLPNRELLAHVRALLRIRLAERELSAQLKQQASVAQLGQVALSGVELHTLLRDAMALTAQTLDAASCTVMEFVPATACLILKAATDDCVEPFSVPANAESQAGYTLLTGQPVVSEDLPGETRFSAARGAQAGFASAASVVMPGRDHPYGVLLIHTLRRRAFSQDDMNFAQTVANVLSAAIQRDRDQAALRQLATKLRAVTQVSQLIMRLRDPDQLPYQRMVDVLREVTGAYHACLFVRRGDHLEIVAAQGGSPGVEGMRGLRFDPAHGLVGHAARTGQPVLAPDVRADPRYLAADMLPDTRCELAMPVISEGRVLGVLDLQSAEVAGLDSADAEVLGILADQLAVVMDNAVMFLQARLRARELEALSRVSSALRDSNGAREMGQIATDQLETLLDADGLLVALVRPGGDGAVVTASRGAWAWTEGMLVKPGQGALGEAMAAGRPLANDAVTEQQCGLRGEGADPAPHALACAPLGSRGRSLGALAVRRPIPFSDADVGLLSAVADIVANAIQRAASYERMEHSLKQAQATHEISIAIAASMEAHLSLGFVLKHVLAQLGADAACVLKLKASTRVYEFVAGRGFHSRAMEQARLRMSLGPLSQATLERRLVSIPALRAEPAYAQAHALTGEDLTSGYIAPLIAKGRVNGVLEVFCRAPSPLTPSQISFLDTVTTQAALALDNAELFAGLQQSNIELSLAYQATLEGWARALQLRDPLTETHSMQTVELTERLARAIGIEENKLVHVRRGAILHDIGKLGIPDSILRKPGPLTPEEWAIMRQHPQHARDLLWPIEYLRPAIDIPYCHHERWDGSGYPRGMRGAEIPLAARAFSVVDVWDALRYDRPYRPGWSGEQVAQFLLDQRGQAFDPQAVDTFVKLIEGEKSDNRPARPPGEVFISDRD